MMPKLLQKGVKMMPKLLQKGVKLYWKSLQKGVKLYWKSLQKGVILYWKSLQKGGNMLKRKIDNVLLDWYKREDHNPLIVYGSRQIGKSTSILNFAKQFYKSVIEINFIRDKEYKKIFDDGFNPDDINYNIS